MAKARLLLLGLDPDIVDYSKSPVPGLTAAKVSSAVEADQAKLEALGHTVKTLYVDDGKTAEAVLAETLATGEYDCNMIGAGLHTVPPYFLPLSQTTSPKPTKPKNTSRTKPGRLLWAGACGQASSSLQGAVQRRANFDRVMSEIGVGTRR